MIRERMKPIAGGVKLLVWLGYLCPKDPYYNFEK